MNPNPFKSYWIKRLSYGADGQGLKYVPHHTQTHIVLWLKKKNIITIIQKLRTLLCARVYWLLSDCTISFGFSFLFRHSTILWIQIIYSNFQMNYSFFDRPASTAFNQLNWSNYRSMFSFRGVNVFESRQQHSERIVTLTSPKFQVSIYQYNFKSIISKSSSNSVGQKVPLDTQILFLSTEDDIICNVYINQIHVVQKCKDVKWTFLTELRAHVQRTCVSFILWHMC